MTQVLQLPVPTRDFDRLAHDMDVSGYALIADALTPEQCSAMLDRLSEQAMAESRLRGENKSVDDDDIRFDVGALLNKGAIWRDLIDPGTLTHQVVDHVLSAAIDPLTAESFGLNQRFILGSIDGTIKRREQLPEEDSDKGHYALMFHIDQPYGRAHLPYPIAVNCFHCLTDFTPDNGSTMLIPGTHNFPPPDWGKFSGEGAIPVDIPAGTVLLWEGRIWHAGGANTNGMLRASTASMYVSPWMRQRWPFSMNLRQDVVDELTDEQLLLLGFDTMFQSEYGSFAGPGIIEPTLGRSNVTTKQLGLGELHLD